MPPMLLRSPLHTMQVRWRVLSASRSIGSVSCKLSDPSANVKSLGDLTIKPRAFDDPRTMPCTRINPTTLFVKKLEQRRDKAATRTDARADLRGPKRDTTNVPCHQQAAQSNRPTGRHPRAVQNPDTPPIELSTTELPSFWLASSA